MSDPNSVSREVPSSALLNALTQALAITFVRPKDLPDVDRAHGQGASRLTAAQRRQLDDMIRTALREGLLADASAATWTVQDPKKYDEGNTAQAVISIPLQLRFVAKWDTNEKLLREASWLRSVAERLDLPESVRKLVPRVYAIRRGEETHSYLMEEFSEPAYRTLARALAQERHNDPLCRRMISAALDSLFTAYDATMSGENHPVRPDILGIYIGRIRERLLDPNAPDELRRLRDSTLRISSDGQTTEVKPCMQLLDTIADFWLRLEASLTPRFVTLVFGDPHPGNIMINCDHTGIHDVRVIDPKEWGEGDYLFEIAKFLHYLEVTWLVEVQTPPHVELSYSNGVIKISYDLRPPAWLSHGRDDAFGRIHGLLASWSARHDRSSQRDSTNGNTSVTPARDGALFKADPHWRTRLLLGLASNLLGVAGSRYLRPKDEIGPNARRVIFAEGARALHEFVGAALGILSEEAKV